MPAPGNVLTGIRARFSIEGKRIGWATNVRWGEAYGYEAIKVIGEIETVEHVPTSYDVTFGANKVRIVGESLKQEGFFNTGGTSEERLQNILISGEINAEIEDVKTGNLIAKIQRVKAASLNYEVNATGVVAENIEFNAIRILDESE